MGDLEDHKIEICELPEPEEKEGISEMFLSPSLWFFVPVTLEVQ